MKNRVFTPEFKQAVVRRMLQGESTSKLRTELQIKRSVLYRWREAFCKEGPQALERGQGRPPGLATAPRPAASPEQVAQERIAELERKIGQQVLDLDFLRRAFKRAKASRRTSAAAGATPSTERSER